MNAFSADTHDRRLADLIQIKCHCEAFAISATKAETKPLTRARLAEVAAARPRSVVACFVDLALGPEQCFQVSR